MSDLVLAGLKARPLANYLAAIGLLRVVAEQIDPSARAAWTPAGLVLSSKLDRDELAEFFVDRYAPTPLAAPWNGSDQGGYKPGTKGRATTLLAAITGTTSTRLSEYRAVIEATRGIVASRDWQRLAETKDGKAAQVKQLRNRLPDSAIRFIDAAVALTTERAAYPPLLGTGGNIGRLDLVTNFLEHLGRLVLDDTSQSASTKWLDELLDGTPTSGVRGSPGQFDSQGVAAMNMARVGKAPERTNPWTFVLSLEGAISFTATATIRLGATRSTGSAPYIVASTSAGYGSAVPEEKGKGEFWAPLWSGAVSWAEINTLISEGRAVWNGRQARSGLDLLRAARTRGVDGGIRAFERYALVERNGQAPIAVSAGTIRVKDEPGAKLTAELDMWRQRLGSSSDTTAPARIRSARRQLDAALFEFSERPGAVAGRRLLGTAASLERDIARSGSFLDSSGATAVPILSEPWAPVLDDGSVEFAIASRLAAGLEPDLNARFRCLADLLRPLRPERFADISIERAGPLVPGLGERPLYDVIADVALERAISGPSPTDDRAGAVRGRFIQFPIAQTAAPLAHRRWVEVMASGQLDERLLTEHLAACLLLDPRALAAYQPTAASQSGTAPALCPAWRVLAPWFSRRWIPRTTGSLDGVFYPAVPPSWATKLHRSMPGKPLAVLREVGSAHAAAGLRLTGSHQHIQLAPDHAAARRLLSALLVPTRVGELRALLDASTQRTNTTDIIQKESADEQ